MSISVLSTVLLATTVVASVVHGDGGVSAFYVWPGRIPGAPGTLLRQEPMPDHLALANAAKALRVLSASTDGIDGKTAIAVSGAIYVPKGTAPAGGWPIVAWAHGTTGVGDVCAPSWMPRAPRDTDYLMPGWRRATRSSRPTIKAWGRQADIHG